MNLTEWGELQIALREYMNLRKAQGIGHLSPEGRRLAAAWNKYEQTLQSEQQQAH